MSNWYILDENKQPVLIDGDIREQAKAWSAFRDDFEKNCRVGDTHWRGIHISTVFLGLDHSWDEGEGPLLFETMIFGGVHDEYQTRYRTWGEASLGHDEAVKLAQDSFSWLPHLWAEVKRRCHKMTLRFFMWRVRLGQKAGYKMFEAKSRWDWYRAVVPYLWYGAKAYAVYYWLRAWLEVKYIARHWRK